MKALFRLTVICFTALFSLCGGIALITASQSSYVVLPELQHCEIGICVLGIIPNTTPYNDAHKLLEDKTMFEMPQMFEGIAYRLPAPVYRIQLFLSSTSDNSSLVSVNEIDLVFPGHQTGITVASIIAQLGNPCVTTAPSNIVLMYPGAVFLFGANIPGQSQHLDPFLSLKEIHLFRNTKSCADLLKKFPAGKWRGFTSYCHYSEIQTQYLALYQNLPFDC